MYLHICTNEKHKCCILSMQQSEMLLYALNLVFFILGFAIYPVLPCADKTLYFAKFSKCDFLYNPYLTNLFYLVSKDFS